jgi:hypothetical protein
MGTEILKYVFMSHHQNALKYHDTRTANKSFGVVAKFKYVGMSLIYENSIYDEIRADCLIFLCPIQKPKD